MSDDTLLSGLRVTLNGFTAACDRDLTVYQIRGVDDQPETRSEDTPRSQSHGDYTGQDWLAGRVIEVDLSGSPRDPAPVLRALRRAMGPGTSELLIEGIPGLPPLLVRGKVRRSRIPADEAFAFGVLRPAFQFYCPDPLLYAAQETVLTLDLREINVGTVAYDAPITYDAAVPYDAGGTAAPVYLTFPVTFPAAFGGRPGLIAALTATNAGVYPTAPLVRVYGPSPAFDLLEGTTNRRFGYSVPVAAEDFVEIDMAARTILLNGQSSRRQFKSGGSAWWDLPPGDTPITYLPDGPAVGARVEVRFRSAH